MARICFVSYEIYPTTWGGCGTLLHNVARVLLQKGHEVIFVLDIPLDYFDRFNNVDRLTLPNPDRCRAYHVDTLCQQVPRRESDFVSLFAWKAYRFDFACRQVCEHEQPDLIEFFDYCGVSHYALSAKVAGIAYRETHLAVRLHNSIEVMDSHEATHAHDFARYTLFALEHSALRLAETVLYPSKRYLEAYRLYYEPWFGRLVHSEPPLVDTPVLPLAHLDADGVLFYGRLFGCKGVDTFVDAAVAYLSDSNNPRLQFYLVGYDSRQPPIDTVTYQAYLQRRIPDHYRSNFVFAGHLTWKQLAELSPQIMFAVFPSYFESFCYAAHELYAAGIPIIVSNIPAFRDYFHHEVNALVFDGSVGDLVRQMRRLSTDADLRGRLSCPFSVTDEPLGTFYEETDRPTWIASRPSSRPLTVLVGVIAEDEEMLGVTLAAIDRLDRTGIADLRIVVFRPVNPKSSDQAAVWWLGALYTLHDCDDRNLNLTDVYTAECLLLLRSGDQPRSDYLSRGVEILSRQPQIAFVGSWKEIYDGNQTTVTTFPLDAMLELVPFQSNSPLSRCVMWTPPGRLLIDLFDPRAARLGEIAYLQSLETDSQCGLVIPEVLITQFAEAPFQPSANLLSYLILHDRWPWRKTRLSRYLLSVWNMLGKETGPGPLNQRLAELEKQLRDIRHSRAWKVLMFYWKWRARWNAGLEKGRYYSGRLFRALLHRFCA